MSNTERALAIVPRSLEEVGRLAESLSGSGLLPEGLRGNKKEIAVIILTGLELGLSPMQAVRGIHIIKGKPTMSADLMVALAQRSGTCRYFALAESTAELATYETQRVGSKPSRLTFTMAEAKAAGLTSKESWKKYPAAMLRARCKAALARDVYPDAVQGIYTPEELSPQSPTDAIDVAPEVVATAPIEPSTASGDSFGDYVREGYAGRQPPHLRGEPRTVTAEVETEPMPEWSGDQGSLGWDAKDDKQK